MIYVISLFPLSILLASSTIFTWVIPKSTFLLLVLPVGYPSSSPCPIIISRSTLFPCLRLGSVEGRAWNRDLCVVLGFFRETEQVGCVFRKRFILRNELMPLWRLESPKSAGWAIRLETQEGLMLLFTSEDHLLAGFPLAWERAVCYFILFCPSTDCMRPTHIMEVISFIQS